MQGQAAIAKKALYGDYSRNPKIKLLYNNNAVNATCCKALILFKIFYSKKLQGCK